MIVVCGHIYRDIVHFPAIPEYELFSYISLVHRSTQLIVFSASIHHAHYVSIFVGG
ncbi:MAG: hypothetical protein J07HQX50_00261 [Haloquadratum sp. J07HQX50]|nr:MAG: hypothetical protein J07HQX50_00261 [Haloquadratum sp. J07HQX50]